MRRRTQRGGVFMLTAFARPAYSGGRRHMAFLVIWKGTIPWGIGMGNLGHPFKWHQSRIKIFPAGIFRSPLCFFLRYPNLRHCRCFSFRPQSLLCQSPIRIKTWQLTSLLRPFPAAWSAKIGITPKSGRDGFPIRSSGSATHFSRVRRPAESHTKTLCESNATP